MSQLGVRALNVLGGAIWLGFALGGSAAAQDDAMPLNSQVRTTGMVGLVSGETAQLNILNPGVPAPFLGIICTARLSFVDDQNHELKGAISQVLPGQSGSLALNADRDVTIPDGRLEIRGIIRTPRLGPRPEAASTAAAYCPFVVTLEIFNAATGRTRVVLTDSQIVFPLLPAPR